MTDPDIVKSNFLIVGAAKCGTTSVYDYLRQHPDVFLPYWKEPAFFSPPEAGGIQDYEEYKKLFRGAAGKKAVGEASVSYLFAPDAPDKIREHLGPDIKILIFLRNPVDMAYSLWAHQVRDGHETLEFEEALAAEDKRLRSPPSGLKCWLYDFAYTRRAIFCPQIGRFEKVFGTENVRIFIFEEFFRDGLPQFSDLCRFLGISTGFIPENKKINAAGTVRFRFLHNMLTNTSPWRDCAKKLIPYQTRMKIRFFLKLANRKDEALPRISDETRRKLQATFDQDVRALERKLSRSLREIWF